MLRSILRNVQYYLLFFSILLVLLAFQRLQFLDHPYAFIDRPTSPDNAGRVFYGGDESKEIGLFKFRLGLFHFALPTFSKDSESWERTSELSSLMTVPPPPHKRRKSTEKMYLRLKGHHSGHEIAGKEAKFRSSVAYIVVIPETMHHLSELQTAPVTRKIKVLAKSIETAHANSPFEYQLYALNLNGPSIANGRGASKVYEAFIQFGFKVINLNDDDLGVPVSKEVIIESERKLHEINEQQQNLLSVLNPHHIVVQMSIDSFLLKPLNDLFDVLLEGDGSGKAMGETRSNEGQAGPKSRHYLLALEPIEASSASAASLGDQSDLIIFTLSSQEAINAYMTRLQCVSKIFSSSDRVIQEPVGVNNSAPLVRGSSLIARKHLEINPGAECRIQAESILPLNRCLYDVGNFNIGKDCSIVSVKEGSRVANIPNGSVPAFTDSISEGKGDTKSQAGGIGPKGHDHCVQPWEYANLDDCSKNNNDSGPGELCRWLCAEWFKIDVKT